MTTFTISIENNSQAMNFEATLKLMGLKYVRFDMGEELAPECKWLENNGDAKAPKLAKAQEVEIVDQWEGFEMLKAEVDAEVDEIMADLGLEEAPKAKAETKKAEAPKKDTKKPAPKKGGKKGSKSDDDFDRELYIELGEHFGVRTKGGVARFARQTMYDAMSEVEKSRSHKLTQKAEKALWKQLMAEAVKFGEEWAIKMVEEGFAKAKAN